MYNNNKQDCGCEEQLPCSNICPVLITSDCVNNFTEDLVYANIIKGQTLTEVLVQFDEYMNSKFNTLTNYISLINVGTGSQVYKGISSIGKKEIRSLLGSALIDLVQSTNDITISVDEASLSSFIKANQKTYSVSNIGLGVNIYKDTTITGDNTQLNLRKLKSSDSSVNIVQGTDDIDITVSAGIVPDGSETKITSGANVSITGAGTISSPYVVNSTNTTYSPGTAISLVGTTFNNTAPDQTVSLTQSGGITITGTYPNFTISSIVADGSETKLIDGTSTTIYGNGTISTPYSIEVKNLQKVITYPADFTGTNYTITNADNNYTIIVNNGSTAVTVTVPSGLTSKIGVGFIQKGTADVSYTASGTTINNPIGLKIKGQYYQTFLEQEAVTNVFYLLGNTKI